MHSAKFAHAGETTMAKVMASHFMAGTMPARWEKQKAGARSRRPSPGGTPQCQ
jgi:hypothetical protein